MSRKIKQPTMSKTINILSVIDVETILTEVAAKRLKQGTAQNPTLLGSFSSSDFYVYMITAQGFIDTGDTTRANSELTVDANTGDSIRWELTCPGSGLQHNAIIANVHLGSSGSITQPEANVTYRQIYDTAGSPGYQVVKQTDFTSTVIASGLTQYNITFQIMDSSGVSQGFYYWDPFIKAIDTNTYKKEREAFLESKMAKAN